MQSVVSMAVAKPPRRERQQYHRPSIVKLGSVTSLTLGGSGTTSGGKPGNALDGGGCIPVDAGQGNNRSCVPG